VCLSLDFFSNNVASEAAGANLKRNRGAADLGFYLQEIWLPHTPRMIFGMTYLVTSYGMFSTKITGS
jgi:hypothetical protein